MDEKNQKDKIQKEQPPKEKRKDFPSGHVSSFKFKGGVQIRNK